MLIHLPQLGHYLQHHVGDAKGDMRQQKGAEAEFQQAGGPEQEHKHQHHRNASDDFRIHHRNIVDRHQGFTQLGVHTVHAYSGGRTDHGGDNRRQKGHEQRQLQGIQNQVVMKQVGIPFGGKAMPDGPVLGIVEGENDEHHDGGIQKDKN